MKFTVSSMELLKKLQFLGAIINSSNTLPVLDNFLFDAKKGVLTITASDLETTISTTIKIDSEDKFSIAIPAKLLLEILKTFPEQPLTFLIKENNVVEIQSNTGEYEIAYHDGADYPKTPKPENLSSTLIHSDYLAEAVSKTLFATGTDDLRPVMCGVLFELSTNSLKFVATDAHKLVKYERLDVCASDDVNFIMPKKPLGVLKSILPNISEKISLSYNNTNAVFALKDYDITCRLIEGKYPQYEAVIPKDNPNKMKIDRLQFLQAVKRVSTFSNKSTHQIRLKIAGTELNISAEDVDYSNKAEERLTCDYEGEDILIGFNSKFLTEMLSNLQSNEIQLEMSVPNRAGILTPMDGLDEGENVTMLVMPVQLNK